MHVLLVALLVSALLSACGSRSAEDAMPLRILVPNATGGGYDTTARVAAGAIEEGGLGERPEVFNVEGGGGAVGLARTVHERGNADLMMMMGLGVVGAVNNVDTRVGLDDVTPIARLLTEPDVVIVAASSPHADMESLAAAWQRRPSSIVVGGGSAPGGPDHLATYAIAEGIGVPTDAVRYERYDGGGPLLAALLQGEIDVAVTGVLESTDQVDAGSVRALAVTAPNAIEGFQARTLQEAGIDVEFFNWRGVVAPPGITESERDELISLITGIRGTERWRMAAEANGWTDAFLTGDEFADFLADEDARVQELLARLD